ncbi:anti-sigma factor [Ramlibacter albus]|uniref:Anti-sigma factor n=1 Tax=Ramlibacter albus TaxID=2079448 RepID=A0A923S2N5_9BURK|nr:anti-sigma factor [Ramlibacter albus]MBC5765575.1 anti-sigma factor [Ramlibacter albus]
MRYSDPRLVDALASAYVLGTLAGGARRRFERLKADRVDVALVVAQWESRLGRLAGSVRPVEPAPRVWAAIEARTRPAYAPRGERSGWVRVAGWGVGGLIAGAGVALAALMVAPTFFMSPDQVAMRAGEKLPASYVGLLTDAEGNGKVLVSSLRHGRVMTVKVIGPLQPPAAGQHMVLWAVPAEGAPFVLGTVPAKGSSVSQLPDTSEKLLSKVGKLMVSLESTASPATPGPVLLRGNCAKLW